MIQKVAVGDPFSVVSGGRDREISSRREEVSCVVMIVVSFKVMKEVVKGREGRERVEALSFVVQCGLLH